MKAITIGIFLMASALILQNCALSQPGVGKTDAKGIRMTLQNLAEIKNVEWILQKMVQANKKIVLIKDSTVTFSYRGERKVAGKASINQYFGNFEMNDKGDISWEKTKFGMTMMAGPPDLMSQETGYIKTLSATDRMYHLNSTLVLENNDRSNLLQFKKK